MIKRVAFGAYMASWILNSTAIALCYNCVIKYKCWVRLLVVLHDIIPQKRPYINMSPIWWSNIRFKIVQMIFHVCIGMLDRNFLVIATVLYLTIGYTQCLTCITGCDVVILFGLNFKWATPFHCRQFWRRTSKLQYDASPGEPHL